MSSTRIRLLAVSGLACVAAGFAAESASALNPQPLPPRLVSAFINPGTLVSLNPQPIPPGMLQGVIFRSPGSLVSLNPQPIPPGVIFRSPGSLVSLNPQPIPPGVLGPGG